MTPERNPQQSKTEKDILTAFFNRAKSGLPPDIVEFLERERNIVISVLSMPDKPEEILLPQFKDRARGDLNNLARENMALATFMLSKTNPGEREKWKKLYDESRVLQQDASERIGTVKAKMKEPIKDPPKEYQSRAGMTNMMILLQLGAVIDAEELRDIFSKMDAEGRDLSGKDLEVIKSIMRHINSKEPKKEIRRAVKEALKFTEKCVNLSYKAQLSMGAKLNAWEYDEPVSEPPSL